MYAQGWLVWFTNELSRLDLQSMMQQLYRYTEMQSISLLGQGHQPRPKLRQTNSARFPLYYSTMDAVSHWWHHLPNVYFLNYMKSDLSLRLTAKKHFHVYGFVYFYNSFTWIVQSYLNQLKNVKWNTTKAGVLSESGRCLQIYQKWEISRHMWRWGKVCQPQTEMFTSALISTLFPITNVPRDQFDCRTIEPIMLYDLERSWDHGASNTFYPWFVTAPHKAQLHPPGGCLELEAEGE